MQNREAITAELKQIDPVMAQWPFHMPYRVPAGYFDALTEKLLEQASSELMAAKRTVYDVPAGYFNQLPGQVLAAVRKLDVEQELEQLAPILNQVSREMPYTRAEISAIHAEVIMEHAAVAEIPVVQMPVRKTRKWIRYMAAAVTTGIILLTALFYNNRNVKNIDEMNFASYAKMDVSQEITRLSEEELSAYLTATEKLVVTAGDRDQYTEDALPDVNEHIQLMSDDELKQYLNESAESSAEVKNDTNS